MPDAVAMIIALDSYAAVPDAPYWLEHSGESSDTFCYDCAQKELAKYPDALLGGGYGGEEDRCLHCEMCGALLEYILTNHGADSEIVHFRTVRFRSPLSREEAYHVARMLAGAEDDPEAIQIAARAIKKIPPLPTITAAQRRILIEASKTYSVDGFMQRRRMCERLENLGLLAKYGLQSYRITGRGRDAIFNGGNP
jgi:hypothetical protein